MNSKKTNAIMLRIIESQYIASKNTDAVFNADAEVKYNGITDKNIRFIEKVQLLDDELWSMVSEQFTFNPEDKETVGEVSIGERLCAVRARCINIQNPKSSITRLKRQ